jgi:hypothetical protein
MKDDKLYLIHIDECMDYSCKRASNPEKSGQKNADVAAYTNPDIISR